MYYSDSELTTIFCVVKEKFNSTEILDSHLWLR